METDGLWALGQLAKPILQALFWSDCVSENMVIGT